MKKPGFYSSGEFAHMAHVTLRTIRYYDKQNILHPSLKMDNGTRFYTDQDFARLQQILLLKYLGFSLNDIREMTIRNSDSNQMINSLGIQLKLVRERIEQMQLVEKAILNTTAAMQTQHELDWDHMLNLIHLTSMENSLKTQYQNASNISSRINLHQLYSQNKTGWFPWIYSQCNIRPNLRILEIGCGDGTFWKTNLEKVPQNIHITLSDISEGMLRDAKRLIGSDDSRFDYQSFDCKKIPFPNETFDLVIANHVLFYVDHVTATCEEIKRVLKPSGIFLCSTYGENHMKEVRELVSSFDERIKLSAEKLYDKFGLENGYALLHNFFSRITLKHYDDALIITDADPLISYIFSCHGNQNQYLINRYQDFRNDVQKRTKKGFHITKDAGIFLCQK